MGILVQVPGARPRAVFEKAQAGRGSGGGAGSEPELLALSNRHCVLCAMPHGAGTRSLISCRLDARPGGRWCDQGEVDGRTEALRDGQAGHACLPACMDETGGRFAV